jgi:molecular chaperone Hsp33
MDTENRTHSSKSHRNSDDTVLPFQLGSGARGRLIRLGPSVDAILTKHNYAEPVSVALGEAVTLAALFGASLKFDGKFILQTQSDGPLGFMVVHYASPGQLRGYASFTDRERDGETSNAGSLLGKGHLAMTIDPGADMDRYQGIVALDGDLTAAAHEYFAQSEQIPTYIRVAVARHYVAHEDKAGGVWTWRAGGLMVQKLSEEGGRPRGDEVLPPTVSDDPEANEDWNRARALASTVEDHELLDPMLAPDRLLYRLFHEEAVRTFDELPVEARCNCSRERVEHMLDRFSEQELEGMADGNTISVTCEFCNTRYTFDARDKAKAVA